MISIIMPAYNAAGFIAEAIDSVLAQTFDRWELIVIDDGSTDDTRSIVMSYMSRDRRIRLIQNNHGGVSQARNTGIKEAKYPWVALLDADDIFLPDRLQKQIDAMQQHPEVVVWASYAYNIGVSGDIYDVAYTRPTGIAEYNEMRRTGQIIRIKNSSALFRHDLAVKLGGYQSAFDSAEDTEFWDRMAAEGPVVVLPEPLIKYRIHNNSLTAQKLEHQYLCGQYLEHRTQARLNNKEALSFEEFVAHYDDRSVWRKLADSQQLRAMHAYRVAGMNLVNGKRLSGLMWLAYAFINNPIQMTPWIVRKVLFRVQRISG
jgi:glycosyltransferase involved in cell wall biosynthesis